MNYAKIYDEIIKLNLLPDIAVDIATIISMSRPRILVHVEKIKYSRLKSLIQMLGLSIEAERDLVKTKDESSNNFIFKEAEKNNEDATIVELWVCLKGNEIDEYEIFENPGRALGYPKCCVKKYETIINFSSYYSEYIFSKKKNYWENNKLASSFLDFSPFTDFFPCSLGCSESRIFIKSILKISSLVLPKIIFSRIINIMKSPLIVNKEGMFIIKKWYKESDEAIIAKFKDVEYKKLDQIFDYNSSHKEDQIFMIPFYHLSNIKYLTLIDSKNKKEKIIF